MTDTDIDKLCEGCCIYELHSKKPTLHIQCDGHTSKDKNCPCQICLVKMMCVGTCDDFRKRNWWGKRIRYRSHDE